MRILLGIILLASLNADTTVTVKSGYLFKSVNGVTIDSIKITELINQIDMDNNKRNRIAEYEKLLKDVRK